MTQLCFLTATELARRIRQREVSAIDVIRAHVEQIQRTNPQINAIVTSTFDAALADAVSTGSENVTSTSPLMDTF